eukprot:10026906-Ditylum_brightwellii.AAC.1
MKDAKDFQVLHDIVVEANMKNTIKLESSDGEMPPILGPNFGTDNPEESGSYKEKTIEEKESVEQSIITKAKEKQQHIILPIFIRKCSSFPPSISGLFLFQ